MIFFIPNLKEYRELATYSQEQLAAESGVSRSTICRIESGKACKYNQMIKLKETLALEGSSIITETHTDNSSDDSFHDLSDRFNNCLKIRRGITERPSLTKAEWKRVDILYEQLKDVDQTSIDEHRECFLLDHEPQKELQIMEAVSRALNLFANKHHITLEEKKEAYLYLITRSQLSKYEANEHFKRKKLSKSKFKTLESLAKFRCHRPLGIILHS